MKASGRTDSQISPVKYLGDRLSSWASRSVPPPLAYQRHHSSKVVTLDSLLRGVTCQVSLTVPLYQLRSSGGTSGRIRSGSESGPVFWVRNSTLAAYQSLSLMIGPETVGL